MCIYFHHIFLILFYLYLPPECAVGSGTFATNDFGNPSRADLSSFSFDQPSDSCLHRIYNPLFASPNLLVGNCDASNPRVIQSTYVDPPACACQSCPTGWTSKGGPPRVTFCFPQVIPRYFKMELEMATPTESSDYDFTNLQLATKIMDAFAKEMSQNVEAGNIVQYGAVQKMNVEMLSEKSTFASIYTFRGTDQELSQLVLRALACVQLSAPDDCMLCSSAAGWNLCSIFSSIAPSSVINRLGISSILVEVDEKPNLVSLLSSVCLIFVRMYICITYV